MADRARDSGSGPVITTVVGGDAITLAIFPGDGRPATCARLDHPAGLALDANGNLFIADNGSGRIRRVDAVTGIITTVAGGGRASPGDGGPATSAVNPPNRRRARFKRDSNGNLFFSDGGGNRVYKVLGAGATARPAITTPAAGSRLLPSSPAPVSFAWTPVAGAARYGFEYTGPGRRFSNPNGTGPDPVNGFGGAGGGFVLSGSSFTTALDSSTPPGTYQVRVIALSAAGQVVGTFSDAVTVVVE